MMSVTLSLSLTLSHLSFLSGSLNLVNMMIKSSIFSYANEFKEAIIIIIMKNRKDGECSLAEGKKCERARE